MPNKIRAGLFATLFMLLSTTAVQAELPAITVYKSATCLCCTAWVDHLEQAGFNVEAHNRQDMPAIKQQMGVAPELQSCHTATVDGYVIEGHVPADDIKRVLKERPNIAGLSAPGMPAQSPGMQAEGLTPKAYDVLSFDESGKVRVYQRY